MYVCPTTYEDFSKGELSPLSSACYMSNFLRVDYIRRWKVTEMKVSDSTIPYLFFFQTLGGFHLYLFAFDFLFNYIHCKQESVHNQLKIFWYGVLPKTRELFRSYFFWGSAKWYVRARRGTYRWNPVALKSFSSNSKLLPYLWPKNHYELKKR